MYEARLIASCEKCGDEKVFNVAALTEEPDGTCYLRYTDDEGHSILRRITPIEAAEPEPRVVFEVIGK